MSTMPSVGSGTYSPGPNMVCSPEQEKVWTGRIEAIICPVYSNLRIRATVSKLIEIGSFNQRLLVAYTAEDVPHAELINKATVVFHRISDRLENPPVQPALQK